MALLNSGTFSYQIGDSLVTFTSLYKSKVAMKPIKDTASRALVGRQYDLELEGYVVAPPGGSTDAALTSMRQTLARPAGILTFSGKGFGTLVVNGGDLMDIAYGPWTELLDWEPRGNDQGAKVHWKATTTVRCEENPQKQGSIIEYCYEIDWDIDDKGLTKRTTTGHMVVAATRSAATSHQIVANADDQYEQVIPELPLGFKRTQRRKLSEDKRRIDFTITDEEIPFPLPEGIAEAEVSQRISFRGMKKGTFGLTGRIGGRLTVPVGGDKTALWDKIMLIVDSRMSNKRAKAAIHGAPLKALQDLKKDGKNPGFMLISGFELDDEIFGLSTSFSVEYVVVGAFLSSLLTASGLWEAVPGTNFGKWRSSMLNSAFAPRGVAGMYFKNSADAIMDLCAPQKPETELMGGKRGTTELNAPPVKEEAGPLDPKRSWMYYDCTVRMIESNRVAVHKPLRASPLREVRDLGPSIAKVSPTGGAPRVFTVGASVQQGGVMPLSDPPGTRSDVGSASPSVTSSTPDLVQVVTSPSYLIVLEGEALRLGYRVPVPELKSIGGVQVYQMHREVGEERVSQIGGIPVWRTHWRILYGLPNYPAGAALPVPVNPSLDRQGA